MLQRLELPYRVLVLAAGDTGFASACTYDLEVWAPGVGDWLEVSSSSTFTDFQARRANIRFRPAPGAKPEFVHTLNASGVAFPRTIAALLENGPAGRRPVRVPPALVPYVGTDRLAPRRNERLRRLAPGGGAAARGALAGLSVGVRSGSSRASSHASAHRAVATL